MKTNLTRQTLIQEASTGINSSDHDANTKKKMTDGLTSLETPLFDGAEMYSFDPDDLMRVGVTVPISKYTFYLCWEDDITSPGWNHKLRSPVQGHREGRRMST